MKDRGETRYVWLQSSAYAGLEAGARTMVTRSQKKRVAPSTHHLASAALPIDKLDSECDASSVFHSLLICICYMSIDLFICYSLVQSNQLGCMVPFYDMLQHVVGHSLTWEAGGDFCSYTINSVIYSILKAFSNPDKTRKGHVIIINLTQRAALWLILFIFTVRDRFCSVEIEHDRK